MGWNPFRTLGKGIGATLYFLDKFANRYILFGKEWETISSRMGKCLQRPGCKGKGVSKFVCALLDTIDRNHCIDAIEREHNLHGEVMMRAAGLSPRLEGPPGA